MSANPSHARRTRTAACLGLAALALIGADGPGGGPSDPPFTALRVDGTTVTGRLRQLDLTAGVSLAVDDKETIESVPAGSLVKLTREPGSPPTLVEGGIVLFPDGDRLYRSVIGPAGETALEVQPFSIGTLAVPLDSILGLILIPPSDDSAAALEARVRAEPRTSEVLWLTNGDRVEGGLLGLDDKKVTFQPAGGKVELDRSGVVALGFDPKLVSYPRPAGLYYELTFIDGTRVGVSALHVEGGHVHARTRFKQVIKLPVADLAQVHAKGGSVSYLSEREPTIERSVAYVGPTRPARANLAVDGQPLRLGGRAYDYGIGTQSRSLLAYRLEPGLKRFQATVGVDDRAGPLGSVAFRVLVDGKERFASPTMSVRDTPKAIDLDIAGAQTLVLITDFGERGEVRDHADWIEARLIR